MCRRLRGEQPEQLDRSLPGGIGRKPGRARIPPQHAVGGADVADREAADGGGKRPVVDGRRISGGSGNAVVGTGVADVAAAGLVVDAHAARHRIDFPHNPDTGVDDGAGRYGDGFVAQGGRSHRRGRYRRRGHGVDRATADEDVVTARTNVRRGRDEIERARARIGGLRLQGCQTHRGDGRRRQRRIPAVRRLCSG